MLWSIVWAVQRFFLLTVLATTMFAQAQAATKVTFLANGAKKRITRSRLLSIFHFPRSPSCIPSSLRGNTSTRNNGTLLEATFARISRDKDFMNACKGMTKRTVWLGTLSLRGPHFMSARTLAVLRGGGGDENDPAHNAASAPLRQSSWHARPTRSNNDNNDEVPFARKKKQPRLLARKSTRSSMVVPPFQQQQSRQFRSTSATFKRKTKVVSSEAEAEPIFPTNLHVSICAAQGFRTYMEDEFVVAQDFAAVFDGHGGKAVSRYLRQNLYAHLQAALPQVLLQKQQHQRQAKATGQLQENGGQTGSLVNGDPSTIGNVTAQYKTTAIDDDEPTVEDYCDALRVALDKVDKEVQRISHWSYQGSTAVAVWLHRPPHHDEPTTVIVANVGDSRAIYGRNGIATALTRDHKPDDPSETARIEAQGGSVVWCGAMDPDTGEPLLDTGIYRVNGNLALSRAIGDKAEKPAVTAEPEITYMHLLPPPPPLPDLEHALEEPAQPAKFNPNNSHSKNDDSNAFRGFRHQKQLELHSYNKEYVVLATDGLWDVLSNDEVVEMIDLLLEKTREIKTQSTTDEDSRNKIAHILVREALRRGAFDNITVIIIWFQTGDGEDKLVDRASSSPIEHV